MKPIQTPKQLTPNFRNPKDPTPMNFGVQSQGTNLVPQGQQQQVAVLPWEVFVFCWMQVHRDGHTEFAVLDPQPIETADEAAKLLRFLWAGHHRQPGVVVWETVPEEVQRHFRLESEPPSAQNG